MGQIPAGATVTVYRAKHDFEYRPGEVIEQGQPWRPMGERNDDYIQKHLCYAETVAIEEDADEEPAPQTPKKKTTKRGSRSKVT